MPASEESAPNAGSLTLAPGLGNVTLHTILRAFRTSVHGEEGNVTINNSQMTVDALKCVKALHQAAGTP
jgi:hypothetical protein